MVRNGRCQTWSPSGAPTSGASIWRWQVLNAPLKTDSPIIGLKALLGLVELAQKLQAAHIREGEEGQRCTQERFPPSVTRTNLPPAWSEIPPNNRNRVLTDLSRLLERRLEEPTMPAPEEVEDNDPRRS